MGPQSGGRSVTPDAEFLVVAATALGSATVGGVFFAFDAFVLHGLAALPGDRGAQAMRSINVSAVRPGLMIALFGTAALAIAACVLGLRSDDTVREVLLAGGAGAYLLGPVLITMLRNVPLNNALAAASTEQGWDGYVIRWGRANRLRMVCALVATAALLAGLSR